MKHDTREFRLRFADRNVNSFSTHGVAAVVHFLEMALTPPKSCLISVLIELPGDVLISCDGERAAMFHWDGAILKAYLGEEKISQSPMHGLVDIRWMTTYFVPDNAYVTVEQAIEATRRYYEEEPLPLVEVPQVTDETKAIYEKLKADGAYD